MAKTGLQNEQLIDRLLTSGSLAINEPSVTGVHYFEQKDTGSGVLSAKLTKPYYNKAELLKSIDTSITELIVIEPPVLPETVLKSTYDDALLNIVDLNQQIVNLNKEVTNYKSKIAGLQSDNAFLTAQSNSDKATLASYQSQILQANTKIQSLITELQTALQKSASDAMRIVSASATNELLNSQLAALNRQIDILNQQILTKDQALNTANTLAAKNVAAAAIVANIESGPLSTITFDGAGDPSKTTFSSMIYQDYGGGQASAGTFAAPGGSAKTTYRSNFQITANPTKDITVDVKFSGGVTQSPYDFGITLPVKIQAGSTLKFPINRPSTYLNTLAGARKDGGVFGLWQHTDPTQYDYTMSITVSDSAGKSADDTKDYTIHLYKY